MVLGRRRKRPNRPTLMREGNGARRGHEILTVWRELNENPFRELVARTSGSCSTCRSNLGGDLVVIAEGLDRPDEGRQPIAVVAVVRSGDLCQVVGHTDCRRRRAMKQNRNLMIGRENLLLVGEVNPGHL